MPESTFVFGLHGFLTLDLGAGSSGRRAELMGLEPSPASACQVLGIEAVRKALERELYHVTQTKSSTIMGACLRPLPHLLNQKLGTVPQQSQF